jgi:hypothetical protein
MLYILKAAWANRKLFAAKGQPGVYPKIRKLLNQLERQMFNVYSK